MKNINWLVWVTSALVLGAVIAGFMVVGSPIKQRAVRFDEQRVNHLSQIQYQVIDYWNRTNKLPANLSDLGTGVNMMTVPKDPETNQSYEYNVKGDLQFELCATFNTESQDGPGTRDSYAYPAYGPDGSQTWSHSIGRKCFERTINPEIDRMYPPLKQ